LSGAFFFPYKLYSIFIIIIIILIFLGFPCMV